MQLYEELAARGLIAQVTNEDEIREMIAFYETPVGQKLSSSLPAITREGFVAGQQLGEEIAAEMIRELQQL